MRDRDSWTPGLIDDLLYRWREERNPDSIGFDARFGTDTAVFTWLDAYEPTLPDVVDATLGALDLDVRRFSFVDLGSGKGRVVFLAARHPFVRVVGVEIAPRLHRIALDNLERVTSAVELAAPIFLYCEDATTHPLPTGPLVLFLYNPFDAAELDAVLARLAADREVHLVYVNPVHAAVVVRHGFGERVRGGEGEVQSWRVYTRQSASR